MSDLDLGEASLLQTLSRRLDGMEGWTRTLAPERSFLVMQQGCLTGGRSIHKGQEVIGVLQRGSHGCDGADLGTGKGEGCDS